MSALLRLHARRVVLILAPGTQTLLQRRLAVVNVIKSHVMYRSLNQLQ